jgi:hypothetical protein
VGDIIVRGITRRVDSPEALSLAEQTLVFPIYLPKTFLHHLLILLLQRPVILEIFSDLDRYAGKSLPVVGDIISPQEMVANASSLS